MLKRTWILAYSIALRMTKIQRVFQMAIEKKEYTYE